MNELSETINQIIDMWNRGCTSGDIATQLKMTRDAVMGRITRLRGKGIMLRTQCKTPKSNCPNKIKLKTKEDRVINVPTVTYAKPVQLVFDYGPIDTGTDITQLFPESCRYIVGHDRRRGALYCAGVKHYRSYCKEHADLCYIVKKTNI